jgi:soluble cytochrome b562
MKIRLLLCTLALAIAPGLLAQAPGPMGGGEREPQTELGEKMDGIGKAFRALRKVDPATKLAPIADASKNESNLKLLATIKNNAVAASKLEPALKAKKPADEQAKFIAAYQDQMKNFIADIDSAIAAVTAGKNDEAAKILDKMNDDQKKGHTDFRPPPKRRNG